MAIRSREVILPLCSTLVRPRSGVLCPAVEQGRCGAVGAGPEEAPAMMRGLEPPCWEERLGELGLFSLWKRRLQGDLIAACQYLKGDYRKDRDNVFIQACGTGQGVMVLN